MAEKSQSKDKQGLKFEQALAKLEKIVEEIEQGEVSLEESIERYAEGIGLVKHCRSVLDSAEKKIQLLTSRESRPLTPSGQLQEDQDPTTLNQSPD